MPMYPGKLDDQNIRAIFEGAGDFIARQLSCQGATLYAYMIDGLVSGGDASEYVLRPIAERLTGDSMAALYENALHGAVYNSVADPCQDLDTVAKKLVNGFCVVLFPEAGARRPGGGKHRQGSQGRLYRDGSHQHQPDSPPYADPGPAAV